MALPIPITCGEMSGISESRAFVGSFTSSATPQALFDTMGLDSAEDDTHKDFKDKVCEFFKKGQVSFISRSRVTSGEPVVEGLGLRVDLVAPESNDVCAFYSHGTTFVFALDSAVGEGTLWENGHANEREVEGGRGVEEDEEGGLRGLLHCVQNARVMAAAIHDGEYWKTKSMFDQGGMHADILTSLVLSQSHPVIGEIGEMIDSAASQANESAVTLLTTSPLGVALFLIGSGEDDKMTLSASVEEVWAKMTEHHFITRIEPQSGKTSASVAVVGRHLASGRGCMLVRTSYTGFGAEEEGVTDSWCLLHKDGKDGLRPDPRPETTEQIVEYCLREDLKKGMIAAAQAVLTAASIRSGTEASLTIDGSVAAEHD